MLVYLCSSEHRGYDVGVVARAGGPALAAEPGEPGGYM